MTKRQFIRSDGVPILVQQKRIQLETIRLLVQSLASLISQGSGITMSCSVGHRRSSDLALLWLWRRLAAVAPVRPLAWEPPYAMGAAPKRQKTKKKKKKKGAVPNTCYCTAPYNIP